MKIGRLGVFALLGALVSAACGGGGGGSASAGGHGAAGAAGPPPPVQGNPPCVISADCPAGQHCDLSECVQDCNLTDPCTGELTCTPRARCLPAGTPDSDPTPTAQYAGTVTATPLQVALTEQNATFAVTLQSTSTSPVQYRVESDAPHVSIAAPTGQFTGTTTLTFKVSTANLQGADVPGSVKIFTSLGDVVVNCPIHVGLTGSYHGALRYTSGQMTLGDAQIALDMIQTGSDVAVRVDSQRSLLFPPTADGETTGQGSYSVSNGLDVTLSQVVDAAFGGNRNHFQRPIGRQLRLQVKAVDGGTLSGTFTETIIGLFGEPVTTTGTATLTYEASTQDPNFTMAPTPAMPSPPSATATLGPDAVFGWSTSDCTAIVCASGSGVCTTGAYPARILSTESTYSGPLQTTITGSQPFDSIADACTASLNATSLADYTSPATECGLVVPLACALQVAATEVTTSDITTGKAAGRLVNEMLAPSLLVAKNDVVNALADSFSQGPDIESQDYDTAMNTLGPSVTWLEQPAILEYLRSMPPEAAEGDDPAGNTSTFVDTYPSARALADVYSTMSVIDGEQARVNAAATTATQPAAILDAQQRAVISYLEAATLGEILQEWGTVPDSVAAKFTDVLEALNHGFGELLNGANAFGVPNYYVPFVYRPDGQGTTNFEQMLNIASVDVTAEASVETTFTNDYKQYQQNQNYLQQQLTAVRAQYDERLQEICGSSFDPDSITTDADWTKCGADQTGQIASLVAGVQIAQAAVDDGLARMKAARAKIQVDQDTLQQTQAIQASDIQYEDATGEQLSAFVMADAALSAVEQAIQVAAQASIVNLGAPAAEAGPEALIGLIKAGIEGQEQELRNAQQMHAMASQKEIALLTGEAEIQKETIDLIQMSVDMHQTVLGVLQAQIAVENAMGEARTIFNDRAQALALLGKDPANDPTYRLLRDKASLDVIQSRATAQAELYLAASALEYELNMSVPSIDGAVLNAYNAQGLSALQSCLLNIFNSSRVAYGTPQSYVTQVSIRQMLGITGPRTDAVTGQALSEGDQFRQILLRNENLDGRGGVGITFATDLQPGNGLWSTDVCEDRLTAVQAQLVGDFLGDNQAQVNLLLSGSGTMRTCDGTGDVVSWSLDGGNASSSSAFAVIQAGVNTYGNAPPNSSLFGQPVARASWQLIVPGPQDAPSNADVDLTHIDDIVLNFSHSALPSRSSPVNVDLSCLGGN